MTKANYEKPASQVDLEARQKKDYQPSSVLIKGEDPVVSDNGYIGVDPIYQNYANETEAPMKSEGGPEAKIQANFVADDADFTAGATENGEVEEDDEDEDETPSGSTGPSTPQTPGTPA